jgi:hypothetical protein
LLAGCPGPSATDSRAPLDPGGARWVAAITATGPVVVRAVGFVDGGVIAAGEFAGTLAIGEVRARAADRRDGFVARLDPRGAPVWVKTFGGPGDDRINALAIGEEAIAVGGEVEVRLSAGEVSVRSEGRPDGFVGALSMSGELRWAAGLGASRYAGVAAVAIGDGGAIYAAGQFAGSLSDGEPDVYDVYSAGNQDMIFARYAPGGERLWLRRAGGPGSDVATGIAAGAGAIGFAGTFMDGAAFAAVELETVGDEPDAVVGRISEAGEILWVKQLGGAGHDSAAAIAVAGDELVAVGRFARELGGAGPTLASAGSTDGWIARFSTGGAPGRPASLGGSGADWLTAVAGGDGVVVGGAFADRAGGDLQSAGGIDGVVSKLAGTQPRWRRALGGAGDEAITALAIGPGGEVAAAGSFTGELEIDGARLEAGAEVAGFVALLEP